MNIMWDQKRYGYFVSGDGFDFFAHVTIEDPEDESSQHYIECDHVQRNDQGPVRSLRVPIKRAAGVDGIELLETLILRELEQR